MPERTEQRKGEWIMFAEAFLAGFFPIVIVLSYATISGVTALAWSTLIASVLFAALMTYRKMWHELKNPKIWKLSIFISLLIGVLFFGFYFVGLEHTTPGNASILVLFQVLTTYIFFNIYRKEHMSRAHKVGAVLMVLGALVVLGRNWSGVNIGDMLILFANFFPPVGNYLQQEARKIASSETIMFLRSIMSAVLLFVVIYGLGISSHPTDIYMALPFLLLNGILFLGLGKIFWIEAIHRIPVTKGIALSSMTPFFTIIFAWIILGQAPTIWQFAALPLLVLGVLLLTDQIRLKKV